MQDGRSARGDRSRRIQTAKQLSGVMAADVANISPKRRFCNNGAEAEVTPSRASSSSRLGAFRARGSSPRGPTLAIPPRPMAKFVDLIKSLINFYRKQTLTFSSGEIILYLNINSSRDAHARARSLNRAIFVKHRNNIFFLSPKILLNLFLRALKFLY